MADYVEIKKSLYSKLTAGTALMANATGIYDRIAPGTATYPYIVYELQTGDDQYTLAGRTSTDYRLVVKGVDERPSAARIDGMMDDVDDLLNNATMTVTGWGSIYIRRVQRLGDYVELAASGRIYQHAPAVYSWVVKQT